MRTFLQYALLMSSIVVGCSDDAECEPSIENDLAPLDAATMTDDENVRVASHVNGPDQSKWAIAENGGFVTRTSEQSIIVAPLPLPHRCILDAVEVVMSGGNSHLAMPSGMPTVELVRRDIVNHGAEYLGVAVDNSDCVELYQNTHSIVLDIDDEEVDATNTRYHVVFKTEYGDNAHQFSWFHGVRYRCVPPQ